MPSDRREALTVVAGFTVVATIMTAPLVLHLASAVPGDAGDPILNAWILGWDADRLLHGLRGVWDAPIFYPYRHTLAYSEHLLGIAPFVAPVQWLTRNPLVTYNVAFIASYVLSGAGMYLLVRWITRRRDAAAIAGLCFALSPYRVGQISHLQVLVSGWMPIGLWALHRYFQEIGMRVASARRVALWLGLFSAAFLLQALSNGYFLYFYAIAVAIVVASELIVLGHDRLRAVAGLSLSATSILIGLLPVALAYTAVRQEGGFVRSLGEIAGYSADLTSYARVHYRAVVLRRLLPLGPYEQELFPGFASIALSVVTLITIIRFPSWAGLTTGPSKRIDHEGPTLRAGRGDGVEVKGDDGAGLRGSHQRARHLALTYAAVAVVAFALSLGPEPSAWGHRFLETGPYAWLLSVVPGLQGLRVPARLATIVILGLSVLAGMGAARLLASTTPIRRRLIAGTIVLLVIAEAAGPFPLAEFNASGRSHDRLAYRWIAESGPGAILELPIAGAFEPYTLKYQVATLRHGHPIVNGYSGYGTLLQEFLAGPATPLGDLTRICDALGGVRALGVRYLAIHGPEFVDRSAPRALGTAIARCTDEVASSPQFGETRVLQLKDWSAPPPVDRTRLRRLRPDSFVARSSALEERLPFAFDGNPETRWLTGLKQTGMETIEIQFARRHDIGLLRLQTAQRSLGDYPRELVIESSGGSGAFRELYRGSVLPQLLQGLVLDGIEIPIDIELPTNDTLTLRLRQVAETRSWYWSIHELIIWER
ncbi:MAG: hypothetical protein HYX76_02875 [Acidobacteria bacterium]|nr:hypothetical protein [Acidobacteriota bacterium]